MKKKSLFLKVYITHLEQLFTEKIKKIKIIKLSERWQKMVEENGKIYSSIKLILKKKKKTYYFTECISHL